MLHSAGAYGKGAVAMSELIDQNITEQEMIDIACESAMFQYNMDHRSDIFHQRWSNSTDKVWPADVNVVIQDGEITACKVVW